MNSNFMRSMLKTKAYLFIAAVMIISAALCACSNTAEPEATLSPAPSPTVVTTPTPQETATPSATEAVVTSTPYELNPVWSFYKSYSEAADGKLKALASALSEAESAEALELSLMCSAHSRVISVLYESIGRLTYTQSGLYSSTINGAEAGSGTLSSTENGFTFEFVYDSEETLSGYFNKAEMYVEFALYSENNGVALLSGRIEQTDSAWISYASESIYDTELCIDSNGNAYFICGDRQAVLYGESVYIEDYINDPSSADAVSSATP